MSIPVDMRQVVLLIARVVDLVGVDDVLHGRRVGIIAVECAKKLGWDQATRNLAFDAGLIHDLGVSTTVVRRHLVNEFDWKGADTHCEQGCRLLQAVPPLSHLASIIRHHHTHWDAMPPMADSLRPLLANLIYLADRVDLQMVPYYADGSVLLHVEKIRSLIRQHRGTFFAPELVDAFLDASRAEAFWLILNPDFIAQYVQDLNQFGVRQQISLADLKQIALVIAEIVDAKSHFTTEHSLGVARLARFLAAEFGIAGSRLDLVEIAALLHDIGKLQIPDEILESPQKLTPMEWAIMKRHSFATYQLLKRVGGLEELAHWASQHHERLDGGGYPFHMSALELPLESKLIKVADIFQALAQSRPYRQPLPATKILALLRQMQTDYEVEAGIIDFVAAHLDECHQAAVGRSSPT